MKISDFLILGLMCLIWGGNFVMSKWMLSDLALPPFFFAAVRFSLLTLLMFPFLWPLPKGFGRMCLAAFCVGALHLAFLYTGLKTAPASAGSIAGQMLIPFATLLSVIFLKERVGIIRTIGIVGALIGVVILIYDPVSVDMDVGLLYIVAAFFVMAVGSILIKGVEIESPLPYLAWMGLLAVPTLGLGSFLFENNQWQLAEAAGWKMGVGILYTAVLASFLSHGQYFRLLKTYDVTLVVPLTLMTPFWAVILGVLVRGESFGMRFVVGTALILPSVYIIARRSGETRQVATQQVGTQEGQNEQVKQ